MSPERKFFRRTSFKVLVGFVVLILALVTWFAIVAIDRPPDIGNTPVPGFQRNEKGPDTYILGNNWMRKSESGLWEVYLEGQAFERGVAFGRLTRELLYFQESVFFEQIRQLVPSDNYLKILKYFTAFFNRNLDKSIPDEYKYEIYGTSLSCAAEFDFIGSGYQRQLNYHAAHDIGHALQGLNLVACTSFSVWDDKSADSCLLVGRNFDFYMGDQFAENKIVCFVNPDSGYKFMMITWADLIGVVSGMNEEGLTVTLNASKSSVPTQAATPVTLLAREILQYASTIDEAHQIALKRKLFVSESIMIGSAKDHQTAIIEKSPEKTALFRTSSDQIICSNHFQSEAFKTDKHNVENIRGSDSYERYRRVEELIRGKEKLDEKDIAAILRDQRALGDTDAGMGNQLAINQLIAHHSVIFKPDSLLVWVSTAPWQLGKYAAYDLRKIFRLEASDIEPAKEISTTGRSIPADSFLLSDNFEQYNKYLFMNRQIREWRKNGQSLPGQFEKELVETNPQLYLVYSNLGDYFSEMKNYPKAVDYYRLALEKKLPGLDVRKDLTERMEKISKKLNHGHTQH